ncbi:23S rRNA (adenine(2503)-C(2))-methyltransferase RlmN [Spirochaetota bacterium]
MKEIIKNLGHDELVNFFKSTGEKSYRAKQLLNWIYARNVDSFISMTNFSKPLRHYLQDNFILNPLEVVKRLISEKDGTEKFLFKTHDDNYIEAVLIKNDGSDDGRLTVCLSSQIGCSLGCKFCHTGMMGFTRDLETGEIIDQLCHIRRMTGLENNNIVFMGMGEPFLNYDNVLKAADILNYSYGFHISTRKITISTAGIGDSIERFIDEKRPYNLAISLNDTVPERRRKYMPVEKKFPILEISKILEKKVPISRNRVTVEYVMRKDNISPDDADRLIDFLRNRKIKLNLIPLNMGKHKYDVPTEEEIDKFISHLEHKKLTVSVRKSMGSDISGACGQLSGSIQKTKGVSHI